MDGERHTLRRRLASSPVKAVAAAAVALGASLLALVLIALGSGGGSEAAPAPASVSRPATVEGSPSGDPPRPVPAPGVEPVPEQPVAGAEPAAPSPAQSPAGDPGGQEDARPREDAAGETARALPARGRPLAPGTWATTRFKPGLSFAVGRGWTVRADHAEYVGLDRSPGGHLTILRVPRHVVDRATGRVVPAPDDVLAWIRTHPCVTRASEPAPATVAGNAATAIEFQVSADPNCEGAYWEVGDGLVFGFRAGERDRLLAVSVSAGGVLHELLVNLSTDDPSRFRAFAARAERLLDSLAFD